MWGRFVYREIVPPERLVFVSSFSDPDGNVTARPVLRRLAAGGAQRLDVRGDGRRPDDDSGSAAPRWRRRRPSGSGSPTTRESMRGGFGGTLDQLAAYLAKMAGRPIRVAGPGLPAGPPVTGGGGAGRALARGPRRVGCTPMLVRSSVLRVVVLAGALVAFVATRPDQCRVSRSAAVGAPPDVVFDIVNTLSRWPEWSPYDKRDPAMKRTLSGPAAGPGASYAWDGNGKVGAGRMTSRSAPGGG